MVHVVKTTVLVGPLEKISNS